MMTRGGIAKVTDFGLARARTVSELGAEAWSLRPDVTARAGTRSYQSPEQAAGKRLTPATDIWSWGVSVLDLFVGRVERGFGAAALAALNQYVAAGEKDERLPKIPIKLVELLRHCFQPEPENRPRNMLEIATALREMHPKVTGRPYRRERPEPAESLADSLNDRAVSLFELGKRKDAEQKWAEALQTDPQHLEAAYNLGLDRWRAARITDFDLIQTIRDLMSSCPGDWLPHYLLACVHVERGDCESALAELRQLPGDAAGSAEVQALRAQAEKLLPHSWRFEPPVEQPPRIGKAITFSADGRRALTGSEDGTASLLDMATGNCLHTFQGHTDEVTSVSLSSDASRALTGSKEGTVVLWEVPTGRCLRMFRLTKPREPFAVRVMGLLFHWKRIRNTSEVEAVCLSADGRFALAAGQFTDLVSLDWDCLQRWDTDSGQCLCAIQEPSGHLSSITSLSLSPDGRLALACELGGNVRLWDLSDGHCLGTLRGDAGEVDCYSASLSADGRRALTGGKDGVVRLWEIPSGRLRREFRGHTSSVHAVSLSAELALSVSDDRTALLWEVSSGRCLRTFQMQYGAYRVGLSADGHSACLVEQGSRLTRLALPPTRFEKAPFRLSGFQDLENMTSARAGHRHALKKASRALSEGKTPEAARWVRKARKEPGYENNREALALWASLYTRLPRKTLTAAWKERTLMEGSHGQVNAAALSARGDRALSGGEDRCVRLWDTSTGECLRVFQGHTSAVTAVCLSADGRLALSGGRHENRSLRVWDTSRTSPVHALSADASVDSLSLSVDGRLALSAASAYSPVRLWDVASGRCLRTFRARSPVCLSADGRLALTGGEDKQVQLWDVPNGRCLYSLEGDRPSFLSVGFSFDGRYALLTRDRDIRVWEVSSGRLLCTLEGHAVLVTSATIGTDGRFILSGGSQSDRTVRVWDVSSGSCLRVLEEHTGQVSSVSLSADGRFALSAGVDGKLVLWFLDWELGDAEPADWHEGARPYLEMLLACHTPYAASVPPLPPPESGKDPEMFWELIKFLWGGLTSRKISPRCELTGEEIGLALTRCGKPNCTEEDFQDLLYTLGCAGYGWLRPQGVRRELKKMAAAWQNPPPLA
jgi:WD40 repeat protein